MTKLEKLAIGRIGELVDEAKNGIRRLAVKESETKNPELGQPARTDSVYYTQVYKPLDEAEKWLEALEK